MTFIILYLLLCVIAAFVGKDSRLGFWGIFTVALFLTPVVAFLLVVLFGRRDPAVRT
jgi:hypothetical protein